MNVTTRQCVEVGATRKVFRIQRYTVIAGGHAARKHRADDTTLHIDQIDASVGSVNITTADPFVGFG